MVTDKNGGGVEPILMTQTFHRYRSMQSPSSLLSLWGLIHLRRGSCLRGRSNFFQSEVEAEMFLSAIPPNDSENTDALRH